VLDGSVASLGSQYVLGLRAVHCRTGEVLAEEQMQAARKEDALHALSRMASKSRVRVGESLMTVEKHDASLADDDAVPRALKAYSAGLKVLYSNGSVPAMPFFIRAIEIDAKFAMAYALLGCLGVRVAIGRKAGVSHHGHCFFPSGSVSAHLRRLSARH